MSKTFSAHDFRFMRRALKLAALGQGLTLPNPRVGAVLVAEGRTLGEGYHHRAGEPHAEVNAVADAKRRGHALAGTTLYVTLEPCSTHGRTPPCTGLILEHQIKRVVYAATDPNPAHAGTAARILAQAGVEVSSGLLAEEAARLNRDFNFWIVKKRPWVVGKIALSLDGSITTPSGDSRWLTSAAARKVAHELRWEADAILIGAETARQDNPRLTVRLPRQADKVQPLRVVVTRSGKLPASLHLFTDEYRERTQVYHHVPLPQVLEDLGQKQISHVLVEGGGAILSEAFRKKLIQEVAFFVAPAVMGTGTRALKFLKSPVVLNEVTYRKVGADILMRGLVAG